MMTRHEIIDSWRDDTPEERAWKDVQHRIVKVQELNMPIDEALKSLNGACPGYNFSATTSSSGEGAAGWQIHAEPKGNDDAKG